jgi:hypothetical protein
LSKEAGSGRCIETEERIIESDVAGYLVYFFSSWACAKLNLAAVVLGVMTRGVRGLGRKAIRPLFLAIKWSITAIPNYQWDFSPDHGKGLADMMELPLNFGGLLEGD